ncbi:hypothetical protein C0991_003792 [Blastosporella zonata]|nr:hypothetical protein C0991_003792 [Blastosporella zonata]
MSLATALERLATYRTNNTRASQDTFEQGCRILKAGPTAKLGDDGWAFLEQLALASIDVGRLDIADECLRQLADKFPKSPRVDVLTGIRMEASVTSDTVLQYYGDLLDTDPANAAVWKRLISVLRRAGKTEAAVESLSRFLDTFYTDAEGWLELADIYTSCNQYTHALESLSHALVLAPQNPFTALQFAETAYTAGDIPLALKMFLVVVDMGERDVPADEPPTGIHIRAWLGVKLCTRQLVAPSNVRSASGTEPPAPKKVKLLEELATERVLAAYKGEKETGVRYVSVWLALRKMRNPLNRLSFTAGKAKPAEIVLTEDADVLAQFLSTSKEKYLQDIRSTPSKGNEWTVVMGNEAGGTSRERKNLVDRGAHTTIDLDSVASSIAYAWLQSEVHKKQTIPLLQLERDDLDLRAENTYALSLAGLANPKEQLLFLTDLAPFSLTTTASPFPSNTFALVDHNSLGAAYTHDNPLSTVTAILDHHADEDQHLSASPRIIAPAGSCTSHVAALFPPEIPAPLATLLLTGILIDTNGLKTDGKALPPDYSAAGFLAPRSTLASLLPGTLLTALHADPNAESDVLRGSAAIKNLTDKLKELKDGVSHLTARDLLRRDYKEYVLNVPGSGPIRAGLASVPVRLRDWKLQNAAGAWMAEREIQVLGVLTSFRAGKKGKGEHRREMAWVVYDAKQGGEEEDGDAQVQKLDVKKLAKKLWKGLEASAEVKVKLKKKKYDMEKSGKLPKGARSRTYNQGEVGANRKITAPLMKTILEASDVEVEAAPAPATE